MNEPLLLTVNLQTAELEAMLQRLEQAGADMSKVMQSIATELRSEVEENFRVQGRPRWQELAEVTLDLRARKNHGDREHLMILQDTGQLAASIQTAHGPTFAQIGTNKVYGPVHQYGNDPTKRRPRLPARPYLPFFGKPGFEELHPATEEAILDLLTLHLKRVADGSGG